MNHNFWVHSLIIALAIPIALYFFYRAVKMKLLIMKKCAPVPDPISDHSIRIKELFTIFLGQKKLFQEFRPGLMHAVIFWGFLILLQRALTMFGMSLVGFNFHLPFLGPDKLLTRFVTFLTNLAVFGVLIMVAYAAVRRYILKVPRLKNTGGAAFVLGMISMLMITDLIFDGAWYASMNPGFKLYAPFGSIMGLLFTGPAGHLRSWAVPAGHISLILHCLGILGFLVYLPTGKHMHILTSLFNVYLRPLHRDGRLTKLDIEDESIESFGIEQMEDHTWKDILDMYTCTECGRCNDACPATQTGKTLAPREISLEENHFLQDEDAERILSGNSDKEPSRALVPDVVNDTAIWECTTCHACEQACPVNIGYVHRIIGLRRAANLNRGEFPKELKRVFKGMENNSNPWNIGASKRADWCKELEIPQFSDAPNAEYLLYLGCAASLDDRAIEAAKATVRLLRRMDVSFAILGSDEMCCGETARRLGEEALGQMLIQQNVELFNDLGVKNILTLCPHCFNTFKNEYPDFGGQYNVIHHSALFAEWIRDNPVFPEHPDLHSVVFHDPCYLARVNKDCNSSRAVLNGIKGIIPLDASKNREHSLCCGAGGGMFWLEEPGERVNHKRFDELDATGADQIAVSCPYCLIMLNDASQDKHKDAIKVNDISEILLDALDK
jgi:Fe-S oxidoreductase